MRDAVIRLAAGEPPSLLYRPPGMAEVRWWQKNVQPMAEPIHAECCEGWNWPLLAGLCVDTRMAGRWRPLDYLSRIVSFGTRAARYDWRMVALFHDSKPAEPLAVAMYLPDTSGVRPSDPRALYPEFFMAQPRELHGFRARFGQYLMDWLIVRSRQIGLQGRVSLQAACEHLRPLYEGWGFTRIDANDRLIQLRRNNGLFYELLADAALAFNQRFDHLR